MSRAIASGDWPLGLTSPSDGLSGGRSDCSGLSGGFFFPASAVPLGRATSGRIRPGGSSLGAGNCPDKSSGDDGGGAWTDEASGFRFLRRPLGLTSAAFLGTRVPDASPLSVVVTRGPSLRVETFLTRPVTTPLPLLWRATRLSGVTDFPGLSSDDVLTGLRREGGAPLRPASACDVPLLGSAGIRSSGAVERRLVPLLDVSTHGGSVLKASSTYVPLLGAASVDCWALEEQRGDSGHPLASSRTWIGLRLLPAFVLDDRRTPGFSDARG